MRRILKKKLSFFGKEISVLVIALVGIAVLASAALLGFYGSITGSVIVTGQGLLVDGNDYPESQNPITETWNGKQFTSLEEKTFVSLHSLENQSNVPAKVQFVRTCKNSNNIDCDDDITTTYLKLKDGWNIDDDFLYLNFDVEEDSETFLLLFIDTKEGGTIYDYGDTGSDIRADYMIVDPTAGAFDNWYLGKWLRQEENGYEGWSQPYDDIRTWNCEGFEANENRTDEVTHYEFKIPLECIEFNRLNLLQQTGAGFGNWSDAFETINELTLEPKESVGFVISNHFSKMLVPDTYTITTEVQPAE